MLKYFLDWGQEMQKQFKTKGKNENKGVYTALYPSFGKVNENIQETEQQGEFLSKHSVPKANVLSVPSYLLILHPSCTIQFKVQQILRTNDFI